MSFHAEYVLKELEKMERKQDRGCTFECTCEQCLSDAQELSMVSPFVLFGSVALLVVAILFIFV